jgi:hypothetical protein
MKNIACCGWLLIPALLFCGQTPMKDKPLKGEWDFCPHRIWKADKAGNDDFGRIAELLVSDQGYVFLRDFEHNISYIFDEKGHFLKKFAPQGSGEGQLSHYINRFQAGEKIVLATPDKLHFFSQDGTFDHSIENNLFLRFPLVFLDGNRFVYAPNLPQSPVNQKKLMLFDIPSASDTLLVDFADSETDGGNEFRGPMVMIFSLTPQVKLSTDGEQMAFGRNDRYRIFIANQTGKIISSFGLERKRMTATIAEKRHHFAASKIPEERVEQIVTRLPDEMTFFSHMEYLSGLIYVFAVTGIGPMTTSQQIDIFSRTGEYLYRGRIEFGVNLQFGTPSNLVIKRDHLYVILKNNEGKQTLAKYRIKLPN